MLAKGFEFMAPVCSKYKPGYDPNFDDVLFSFEEKDDGHFMLVTGFKREIRTVIKKHLKFRTLIAVTVDSSEAYRLKRESDGSITILKHEWKGDNEKPETSLISLVYGYTRSGKVLIHGSNDRREILRG